MSIIDKMRASADKLLFSSSLSTQKVIQKDISGKLKIIITSPPVDSNTYVYTITHNYGKPVNAFVQVSFDGEKWYSVPDSSAVSSSYFSNFSLGFIYYVTPYKLLVYLYPNNSTTVNFPVYIHYWIMV